jgi:hypothetical protein
MELATVTDGRLEVSERAALTKHEKVIQEGRRAFVDVGNALTAIRDGRLYREAYKSFDEYCRQRWDFGRNYGNKLIEAAVVVNNLSTAAKPQSETAARVLSKVPEEKREEVMQAVADAGKLPTAAAIRKAVESLKRANRLIATAQITKSKNRHKVGTKVPNSCPSSQPQCEAGDGEQEDDGPQPIKAIVSAVSRGKIKATKEQLAALATFDEETQEALLTSILAGKQTVAQAIEAGAPPEPTLDEECEAINSEIESFCRRLMQFVEQNMPSDKWLSHMERREGAIQKIKDACTMLRTCKTVSVCPKCEGAGCRPCLNTGRVTRYALEQMA